MKKYMHNSGLAILFVLVAISMNNFLGGASFETVVLSVIFSTIICFTVHKMLTLIDGYLYLSKKQSMVYLLKDGKLLMSFYGSSIDDLPNKGMIIDIAQDSAKGISKYEIAIIQSSYKEMCGLLEAPHLPVVEFNTSFSKRLLSSLREL